jgi:predicted amidohydrolase
VSTLKISIVQADLAWHDARTNLAMFSDAIDALGEQTDLIVLPEMFTTGFTMDAAANAEKMHGYSLDCMAQWAARSNAAICGSLIVNDEGRYFNRFVLVRPDGSVDHYDKRHLFRLAGETAHYAAGNRQVIIEWRGWRICPMVCYDLRFPVWSRSTPQLGYELLLYVANWPSRRHHAWRTLLRARAIENLSYVAGVNRTGTDGNELTYAGGSAIIDYLGHDLADLGDRVATATATLDKTALLGFREKIPFHIDADAFSIIQD